MKNLNTHIRIVLIVLAMFGLANFANAQRKATRVIDNKGNIKYVLDSSSKFIDTAYNGLTKLNDSTLVLGGKLTQNTTIDFNDGTTGHNLAFANVPVGLKSDSLLTIDPSTGNIRQIRIDSLFNTLIAANGLTKNGDSVKLGGALNQPTTISATPTNSLTLASGGAGSINITGLTSGQTSDSILTIDPATNTMHYVSKSTLLNGLVAKNGLHKDGDSVKLGGDLTENTIVNTAGKGLVINVNGGTTDSLAIQNLPTTGGATDNLVVVDATTGKLKQMVGTSLLQSGEITHQSSGTAADLTIAATGMPATPSKIWVYRNGAKLIQGTDFTVAADTITLTPVATGNGSWSDTSGDVYEVQWVK